MVFVDGELELVDKVRDLLAIFVSVARRQRPLGIVLGCEGELDYNEVGVVLLPAREPGCVAVRFGLLNLVERDLYATNIETPYCYYAIMARLAKRLGRRLAYVDWPMARFTIEAYSVELATFQSQTAVAAGG